MLSFIWGMGNMTIKYGTQPENNSFRPNDILAQSFFNNIPMAVVIYQVKNAGESGMDYIIKDVNPAALKIENWRRADVIGKPLAIVRPGVEQFGIIEIFRRVWETGQAMHYPAQVYKDGPEERWYENTVFKLPSGEVVAVYDDVTEHILSSEQLHTKKEKLKVTLFSIDEGVITTDKDGKVEMLNPKAESLTGWTDLEAKGQPLNKVFNIYSEQSNRTYKSPALKVLEEKRPMRVRRDIILENKYGEKINISISASPIKDKDGDVLGVVLVFRDITKIRQQEKRISDLSYRDSLTKSFNRAYLERAMDRLDTEENLPISLVMGDLNGLKLLNDVFGHHVGDKALIEMSEILQKSCRSSDVVCRWGGDEFVILLPKSSKQDVKKVCERVIHASEDLLIEDIRLSISLGYATKENIQESLSDTLKRAEKNMYRRKLIDSQKHKELILSSLKDSFYKVDNKSRVQSEKLRRLAGEFGKFLSLPSQDIRDLELLAMVHDLGKASIDNTKIEDESLVVAEWDIINKHPEIGYRIASAIPELVGIAEYILTHHERWDGKGHPRGLKGKDIPFLSRIFAVVDYYVAMTEKELLSPVESINELKKMAHRQLDPEIVDKFIQYLKEKNRA